MTVWSGVVFDQELLEKLLKPNCYWTSPAFHVSPLRRAADPYDAHKAWQSHLDRLAEIDRLYPSRYGLYLKDRASPVPSSSYSDKGLEYEPENKPHFFGGKLYR